VSTAFQPNAFQPDAFQEYGGVTAGAITIAINGTQDGDTGLLTVNVKRNDVIDATGGWGYLPSYPKRRRPVREVSEDVETPEEVQARIAAVQQRLALRKELRQAELRDQQVTAQLRQIFAEQDALALSVSQLEQVIERQKQDDDDLALILALAS
jgi:hypothetical protein